MISVALAGSTKYAKHCAAALAAQTDFSLSLVITPEAKPSGRNKLRQQNPLSSFAEQADIPQIYVREKISAETKNELNKYPRPDFLLIVDFGYWIPEWLRTWPLKQSLNVHPSQLPRWRGSSPGQFVLLYGEAVSAVSLIEVVATMDTGAIYWQQPFAVAPTWTQTEYYEHAYSLVADALPKLLRQINSGELSAKPQLPDSPTPLAHKLTRDDGFVAWRVLQQAVTNQPGVVRSTELSPVLAQVHESGTPVPDLLLTATRALSPWPQLWTSLPTRKGDVRMKIHSMERKNGQITLEIVQLAGKKPAHWQQIKSAIIR